jgi:signal transduction histidine kinase
VFVRVAEEPRSAVVEVEDTGVGISPAECEQLFTPFFRTESARVHAVQGTGLGLAISKALVVAHGGSISCRSAEGVGTTFRVELPPTALDAPLALAGAHPDPDGRDG